MVLNHAPWELKKYTHSHTNMQTPQRNDHFSLSPLLGIRIFFVFSCLSNIRLLICLNLLMNKENKNINNIEFYQRNDNTVGFLCGFFPDRKINLTFDFWMNANHRKNLE